MASPPTDSNATRFGVRLHAPDGSNREALEDLARVLSTFARRPTGSLAEQLSKGPIVLEEGLTENEARELVEVFRQMGALAELVEPSSRSTRPLFAQSEAAQIASAWRQVVSGTRPVSSVGAAAAAAEPGETRRMSAMGPGLAEPPTTRFQAASAAPPIVAAPAVRDVATLPTQPQAAAGADTTVLPAHVASTDALASLESPALPEDALERDDPFATVELRRPSLEVASAVPGGNLAQTTELDRMDQLETREMPARAARCPSPELNVDAGVSEDARTAPLHAQAATIPQHGIADRATVPRNPVAGSHDTTRLAGGDGRTPQALNVMDTGSMGSVAPGPRIFQLAAPPSLPSDTGRLGTPARLDPVTDAAARFVAEAESRRPRAGAVQTERPGVYKLPPSRPKAEPSVVTSVTADEALARASAPAERVASGPTPAAPAPAPAAATHTPREARKPIPQARPSMVPSSHFDHDPRRAAWMSMLVPGLGQVYNGQRERGILFALGTPLVLPYLFGIYDAWQVAESIAAGRYLAPDPSLRRQAYVGQVALGLAMIAGVIVALLIWDRASVGEPTPGLAPTPPVVAVAPPTAAPREVAVAPSRVPLGDDLPVPELMRKGRQACGRGLYAECEEIMHAIIAREPENRDAMSLLVEAAGRRTSGSAPPSVIRTP
jgi:hypothetical protein